MSLEHLPTEIWLIIFEFFTVAELFQAFYDINNHFRSLLSQFQYKCTDIQSISRIHLNAFCEDYLPLFCERIVSLRLSNNEDCPQQISVLGYRNFTFDRLIRLQSLSLSYIHSIETLRDVITQLSHLQQFIRLTVNNFTPSEETDDNILSMINSIWSLPKLTYLRLDVANSHDHYFIAPRKNSSSLKHVELLNFRCHQRDLVQLFQNTPCLRNLSVKVIGSDYNPQSTFIFEPMHALNLFYRGSWNNLQSFLQIMPNLSHLTINTALEITADGHIWEQFITEHLPNLTVFRFVISYKNISNIRKKQQAIHLLDSFRSSFWLDKYHLCVRCDWQAESSLECVYLYTLPYVSSHFYECFSNFNIQSRTTCTHNINHHLSDGVTWLNYDDFPSKNSNVLPIRLHSLRHLSLTLPVDNMFQSNIPRLDRLVSLQLRIGDDDMRIQLQNLLDAAPKLRTLKFVRWPMSLIEQIKSTSIRQLDLSGFSPAGLLQYFDREQCDTFSHTSLGLQCEVLCIAVQNKRNIIDLVNNMRNLRVLVIKYAADGWKGLSTSLSSNDERLEWLRIQLPPTCVLSREPRSFGKIRIWIM